MLGLADVIVRHGRDYLARYGSAVPQRHVRALDAIARCRTGAPPILSSRNGSPACDGPRLPSGPFSSSVPRSIVTVLTTLPHGAPNPGRSPSSNALTMFPHAVPSTTDTLENAALSSADVLPGFVQPATTERVVAHRGELINELVH